MHPETAAPSLLFISSFVSLILIVLQIFSLRKSQWDLHDAQGTRRLLALSVMLLIALLSALSGTLGLVAYEARRTGDRSRAARVAMGGKIIVVILQSGRKSLYICHHQRLIDCSSLAVHDVSFEFESSDRAYTLTTHQHSHFWKSENLYSSNVFPTRSEYETPPS